MSKEELRIVNQNAPRPPKKRISTPSINEPSEPKSSPIDYERLSNISINLHKATFNKISQENNVKSRNHLRSIRIFSSLGNHGDSMATNG